MNDGGVMEALGFVGSSLDKLGPRPLRGLLAGRPRELASIVPFSDAMGLTDPQQIASGRDVTDTIGWTRRGASDPTSHAMGLMAEALLDPAALAGTGALAARGLRKARLLGSAGEALHVRPTKSAGDRIAEALYATPEGRVNAMSSIGIHDYKSMLGDEGSPLGRLNALSKAAGVKLHPDESFVDDLLRNAPTSEDAAARFAKTQRVRFGGSSSPAHAVFAQDLDAVWPNTHSFPELWSDQGQMARAVEGMRKQKWLSTAMPEHIAVHEIGHGLHHQMLNALNFEGDPLVLLPHAWRENQRLSDIMVRKNLSDYAQWTPAEYVAEAFAKRAGMGEPGASIPPWMPEKMMQLYQQLKGPQAHPDMVAKLMEYLRG